MCSTDIEDYNLITLSSKAVVKGGEAAKEKLTPEIPSLPGAPDAPPRAIDPIVQAARSRERDKARAAASKSTLLTGGGGLASPATTAPKTLLGS